VFNRCYDAGPYAREIRYGEDVLIPPLEIEKADWVAEVLKTTVGESAST
jgi:hypothetical protein